MKIKRFDIVAVNVQQNEDQNDYWIKRVIGLPNEVVHIQNDTLYINGKEVRQDFKILEKSVSYTLSFVLKEDQYFVLGDNREITAHAIVTKDQFIAKGGFVYSNCKYTNGDGICDVSQRGKWVWL